MFHHAIEHKSLSFRFNKSFSLALYLERRKDLEILESLEVPQSSPGPSFSQIVPRNSPPPRFHLIQPLWALPWSSHQPHAPFFPDGRPWLSVFASYIVAQRPPGSEWVWGLVHQPNESLCKSLTYLWLPGLILLIFALKTRGFCI